MKEGAETTMENKDLSVLQPYCENDMQLLKKISKSVFIRFHEPLAKADHDDFYSIANMTLWQAYNAYNLDLCQYFGHKKLKVYADFFNSSSSFCWGVI